MKQRTILLLTVVLVMVMMLAACGFSVSTARIESATLAKGYDNGEAVEPTSTFAPTDQTIHLVVRLANAPDGTTTRAVWSIVDVEGYEPTTIDSTDLTVNSGEDRVDFTLSNETEWPAGKYKVELYLNDELNQTLEYQVQ